MRTAFKWTSDLIVQTLTHAEIFLAWRQGLIGDEMPELWRPWVRLLHPLRGESDIGGEFEVPPGFIYDQASVPRLVAWVPGLVSPTGSHIRRAACLHDWRCPWPGKTPDPAMGETLTPAQAAEELRSGMLADGAAGWRASLVRWAVANFGPRWSISSP